jgi:hypothetical protein
MHLLPPGTRPHDDNLNHDLTLEELDELVDDDRDLPVDHPATGDLRRRRREREDDEIAYRRG